MAENKVPNKKAICDALVQAAKTDRDIVVLCSDSRGSASFGEFIEQYPDQLVEVGIAEQDLVGVSAGLARCGKKAFAVSPACFLTTRSIEQVKVDVCYSHTNVKLIGISGGISYGALGMSHHSAQDVAYTASLPGMRVYLPSDRFQSYWLVQQLLQDTEPAYLRVGRSAVEDLYDENTAFELNRAKLVQDGTDLGIIACGEMVQQAAAAARTLGEQGISCRVVDMYCLKPIDRAQILETARSVGALLTVEEHTVIGGLGEAVSEVVCTEYPVPVHKIGIQDEFGYSGNGQELLERFGLTAPHIAARAKELVTCKK